MKKLLMFLSIALLAFACSSDEDVLTGSIQGTVTEMINGESRPLSEVLVRIDGGSSVTTDSNGKYAFLDIDAQPYKLQFSKYGYLSTTRDVNVVAGKTANCDVRLDAEKKDLIVIEPASLNFGTTQTELPVVITNKGNRDLKWNLDLGQHKSWLSVSPSSGQLSVGKTQTIVFSVNRSNVQEAKSVVINLTAGGSSFPISINCGVEDKSAQMIVDPTNIDFGTDYEEKDITIKNVGTATLTWKIKNLVSDCITISETESSIAPNGNKVLKLKLDRDKMTENINTSFVVSDGVKEVKVNVIAIYEKKEGKLTVDNKYIDFGSTENAKTITLSNKGNAVVDWKIENITEECISISPKQGVLAPGEQKTINITLNRDKMTSDIFTSFNITDGTGKITVNVSAEYEKKEGKLIVDNKYLDFGKTEKAKTITLSNKGNAAVDWKIENLTEKCISLSPKQGLLAPGEQKTINITINRDMMTSDIFTSFNITDGTDKITVKVSAEYEKKEGKLIVDNTYLDFGKTDNIKTINLSNKGNAAVDWKIDNLTENCISLSPKQGTLAPGEQKTININLNRDMMTSNIFTSFNITDGISNIAVKVSAEYEKKEGKLIVDNTYLDFGSTEEVKTINLSNKGNAVVDWKIENITEECISISPKQGVLAPGEQKTINITLNRDKMTSDIFTSFNITDGTGKITVNVSAELQQAIVSVNPKTLDFGKTVNEKTITLRNTGNVGTTWDITEADAPWLTVSPSKGYIQNGETVNVNVKVDRTDLNNDEITAFNVNAAGNTTKVDVYVEPADKPIEEDYSSAIINVNDTRLEAKITDCKRTGTTLLFHFTIENKGFGDNTKLRLLAPKYPFACAYQTYFYDDLGGDYFDMNKIIIKFRDNYTGWANDYHYAEDGFPEGFPCKGVIQIKEVKRSAKTMNFKIGVQVSNSSSKIYDDKIEFLDVPIYDN